MKTLFLFLNVLILFFSSCMTKDDSAEPNYYAAKFITQLNQADTFLYKIPKIKNLPDSYSIKSLRKYYNRVGFESLEKGFDSIEIRIDYGCSLFGDETLAFVNKKGKWKAIIFNITHHQNTDEEKPDSFSYQEENKFPKSGWQKFINQLFDLKILTLIDQNEIPDFKNEYVNDGCGATIEIATKNTYRLYEYANPDLYSDQENKNIIQILTLINHEFGIKLGTKGKWVWPIENPDTTKSIKAPKVSDVKVEDINTSSEKQ